MSNLIVNDLKIMVIHHLNEYSFRFEVSECAYFHVHGLIITHNVLRLNICENGKCGKCSMYSKCSKYSKYSKCSKCGKAQQNVSERSVNELGAVDKEDNLFNVGVDGAEGALNLDAGYVQTGFVL